MFCSPFDVYQLPIYHGLVSRNCRSLAKDFKVGNHFKESALNKTSMTGWKFAYGCTKSSRSIPTRIRREPSSITASIGSSNYIFESFGAFRVYPRIESTKCRSALRNKSIVDMCEDGCCTRSRSTCTVKDRRPVS